LDVSVGLRFGMVPTQLRIRWHGRRVVVGDPVTRECIR
jgi:hypothetical protein